MHLNIFFSDHKNDTCSLYKLWAIEKSIEIGEQKLPEILSLAISIDYNLTIAYFPRGSDGKESACNSRDLGSIPGLGRSPGGRHGNPLQYSCLENPHGQRSLADCSSRDREEGDTTEWLSTYTHFPRRASLVAQMVENLPAVQETQVRSLGGEDPWRRKGQPTPVFLPGEARGIRGQRSLAGYSPWVSKRWTQLTFSVLFP